MPSEEYTNTPEMSPKKSPSVAVRPLSRKGSKASTSSSSSIKKVRVARFAEAITIDSPTEPKQPIPEPLTARSALGNFYQPQAQPADVGFGYLSAPGGRQDSLGVEMPYSPVTPLKSAMKTPKTATFGPRTGGDNPLSPTFKEEGLLRLREKHTDKEQKRDLRSKVRVRIAKMILRSTNFTCSLIVLGMLGTTFSIFNATRAIPPRNNLPPWAEGTNPWAQIVLLVISCVSLFMSLVIFYGYWKGGHKRAERAAVWYTVFSVGYFTFSIVMWGIGAGVLHSAKSNGNGQDLWGWSCKDNTRSQLFGSDVSYQLVCRLQNWSLVCCLIEVVVETITILIYGVTFHRYYTKHRLHKSMDNRDKARSSFFMAQLKSQPNTPGLAPNASGEQMPPYSARDGGWNPMYSARWAKGFEGEGEEGRGDELNKAEQGSGGGDDGENVRYLSMEPPKPKPFTLQAPPTKNTPKAPQVSTFNISSSSESSNSPSSSSQQSRKSLPVPPAQVPTPQEQQQQQQQQIYAAVPIPSAWTEIPLSPIAPGEQVYDAVPIPGSYSTARMTAVTATVPETDQQQYEAVPIPQQYGAVPIPSAYQR